MRKIKERPKRKSPEPYKQREQWTEAENDILRTNWPTLKSATEIGTMVNNRTKSAVLGQARRLGLGEKPQRASSKARNQKRGRKVEPKTTRKKPVKTAAPVAADNVVNMTPAAPEKRREPDLEPTVGPMGLGAHTCNWPIGDPGHEGFGFCGRRVTTPGQPKYCPEHMRVAFQPVQNTRGGYAKTRRV